MLLKGENANSIQKEMQLSRTLQKEKPRAESNDRKIVLFLSVVCANLYVTISVVRLINSVRNYE